MDSSNQLKMLYAFTGIQADDSVSRVGVGVGGGVVSL